MECPRLPPEWMRPEVLRRETRIVAREGEECDRIWILIRPARSRVPASATGSLLLLPAGGELLFDF